MVENAIFTLKTQIMATLTLVIVPAKRLSDGTHKIRIRVAHNSETRFITTDIVVRENEFKNGKIVHRPDKDFLNTKLQQLYNLYFKRYMELDYPDSLTCTQLVKMITNPLNGEKHRKFEDIVDEYTSPTISTLSSQPEFHQPKRGKRKSPSKNSRQSGTPI